ncbi:MAG: peptidoglycan bridge formation glycyltransferase FemA/FemB family protein [Thermodesulfobacteriota bacterium]
MIIRKIKPEEERKYDEIAMSCGTIFNTTGWTKLFGEKIQHYGIYNDGIELIGGFTTYCREKFGLHFYTNPPFTPTIGPFFTLSAQNPVSLMNLNKEILSLICQTFATLPHSVFSIRFNRDIVDLQPFIWRKYKVVPVYTYVLDLTSSIDTIWKRMSGVRRKNIRKALKDGIDIRKAEDLGIVKSLIKKTFARQNTKVNIGYLERILYEFCNKDNSFGYISYSDRTAIACAYCIHDSRVAYYLFGGFDVNYKHHGAGTLALWQCIQNSISIGLNSFDFEGSMIPSIEKYFRGFGGDLKPYYCVNKAPFPLEVILKLFKREYF